MKQQHRKAPSHRRYTDHHPLDGMATWSSDSLLRMDEQFVVAVEVAFRRGARASIGAIRAKPVRTTVSDKAVPCPLDHVNRQSHALRPNAL